jgi:hypothetical protein
MAPMREKNINKVIANISTNNAMQIVLILILFSQVTYAWDWRCLGALIYTLSYDNFSPNEITRIECFSNAFATDVLTYEKNPELHVTFCGSVLRFPPARWTCNVYVKNSYCDSNMELKQFEGFSPTDDCAKDKERHCHWQVSKESISLYNPKKKEYESRIYFDDMVGGIYCIPPY